MSVLSSVSTPGLGTSHQFAYNGSAEMTQVTTPLGGTLGWGYGTNTYTATGRSYREVWSRTMSSGSMSNTWYLGNDGNPATLHTFNSISDSGANASKVWWFNTRGFQYGRPQYSSIPDGAGWS